MKEHDPPPPDDKDTDECSPSAGASFHWPDSSYPDLSCHVSDIIELGSKAVDIVPQVYEILLRQPHLRDRGYLKATTRMTPLLSPEELMSRLADTTITSAAHAEFNGFLISQVHTASGESVTRAVVQSPHVANFKVPQLPSEQDDEDPREQFSLLLGQTAKKRNNIKYLVIETSETAEWREGNGLPRNSFLACCRRLAECESLPGINTPYSYISGSQGSPAPLHVEDALLYSVNAVLTGASKLWLIIPPRARADLEARIRQNFEPTKPCSQFVRHQDIIIHPNLLEKWNIPYDIVRCKAGEVLVTVPGAYHEVLNSGANVAEAINFALDDWKGPGESYAWCQNCCETPLRPESFGLSAMDPPKDYLLIPEDSDASTPATMNPAGTPMVIDVGGKENPLIIDSDDGDFNMAKNDISMVRPDVLKFPTSDQPLNKQIDTWIDTAVTIQGLIDVPHHSPDHLRCVLEKLAPKNRLNDDLILSILTRILPTQVDVVIPLHAIPGYHCRDLASTPVKSTTSVYLKLLEITCFAYCFCNTR
ncbi:putative transcription factor jumonji aspartyl beta-hydroxylase protein [Botryosphaeria dothidea]|uniref:Transcription factor jumonji aspartyl beta-hydroxylase protein n=1 Tax=Botryosphaeria dothidea TaxID=55169 RepID=A0A8H4N975_9PEZI|nr:putative transcription factor jumonji aspartyl beta-hydroxylase protein [Botryosphaeria dothidea]